MKEWVRAMTEYITKREAYEALRDKLAHSVGGPLLPSQAYLIAKIIDDIPAADVTPEIYTEWIGFWGDGYADGPDGEPVIVYEEFECSRCGCVHHADGEPTWDYCPECGARMTEKPTTEYGKGYFLKKSLLDLVEWDNDIEQWVISDHDSMTK